MLQMKWNLLPPVVLTEEEAFGMLKKVALSAASDWCRILTFLLKKGRNITKYLNCKKSMNLKPFCHFWQHAILASLSIMRAYSAGNAVVTAICLIWFIKVFVRAHPTITARIINLVLSMLHKIYNNAQLLDASINVSSTLESLYNQIFSFVLTNFSHNFWHLLW